MKSLLKAVSVALLVVAVSIPLAGCPESSAPGRPGQEDVGASDNLDVRVIPAAISAMRDLSESAGIARRDHFAFWHGQATVRVIRASGKVEYLGKFDVPVPVFNVVTTVGKEAIVDALQGTFTLSDFKFHGVGTGSTAPTAGDTALVTEVETRATGTQTENGSTTYETVGTVTATAARAIQEAGLFSASTAGTMLARVTFSTVNLSNGDSIETTWDITIS